MDPRIVLHTGFMKTGTTFLQNGVFPGLPQVALHSYADGRPFVEMGIRLRNGAPESAWPAEIETLHGWVARSDRPVQLFSWEGLVGGYLADYRQFPDLTRFFKRAFPDAHVLLVIRKQGDLAESLYRQALQTYHWPTVETFLNRTAEGYGAFRPEGLANIDVRSLDFLPFVEAYEAAFGADRVHVVPYEWLRAEPDRFYAALSAALGTPVSAPAQASSDNRGYSVLAARIARRLNRFYRTPHNPRGLISPRFLDLRGLLQRGLDRVVQVKGDLIPAEWRAEIMALHARGNRALDQRRELGLVELGY
jgi:hypothetical protein